MFYMDNKNYFKNYVSNTLAGTGNQLFFDSIKEKRGRIFYKVFKGGKYSYSFLFSNTIDSTFSDGKVSKRETPLKKWKILSMKVKVYDKNFFQNGVPNSLNLNDDIQFKNVTFNGKKEKEVLEGEIFYSDEIELNANKDDYICIEISFDGRMIGYHEEILIPTYVKYNDNWILDKKMPVLWQLGIKRQVSKRIAFLGDSITQGIGCEFNSYKHWCSLLAEKMGDSNAYWNLGIGFGRADDCAIDGKWLYKAKQNDIVFICFGVNDINRGFSEQEIKSNFEKIVDILNKSGCKIILQTIPPFNYDNERIEKWEHINYFIKNNLSKKVFKVIDNVNILKESNEKPYNVKYGLHPNEIGNEIWANFIYENVKGI